VVCNWHMGILPMSFAILELLSFPRMSCLWGWTLKLGDVKNERNFSPSISLEATSPLSAFPSPNSRLLYCGFCFLSNERLAIEGQTKDRSA
jgi:hypothetical protein